MKCAGVSVHSLANQLQWTCHGSNSYLTCSLHLFPFFFSPGWPQCFSEPNAGGTSFQWLPGDFKCLSNKEQSRRQGEEKGPATIPRPSFTNYAEYLLTGGLSLCLLSHLTPLIFPPLQHPITFHPALLQLAACCGEEAPRTSRQTEKTKEKEDKEDTEEDGGKFGSGFDFGNISER